MAAYGQVIDSDFDPRKENIHALFAEYFENPIMTKVKDVDKFSVYMAKIHALLGVEYRYLIVFVDKDGATIGTTERLDRMKWVSLQTRTLTDEHKLQWHAYTPRRMENLDKKITLTYKNDKQYVYKVQDLPLTITLLPKSKGLDYNTSGSVVAALETYQTIVNFV